MVKERVSRFACLGALLSNDPPAGRLPPRPRCGLTAVGARGAPEAQRSEGMPVPITSPEKRPSGRTPIRYRYDCVVVGRVNGSSTPGSPARQFARARFARMACDLIRCTILPICRST
jgi:hypothetical protein